MLMASMALLFLAYLLAEERTREITTDSPSGLGLPPPVSDHECSTLDGTPTSADVKELYDVSLTEYDTRIRPRKNQTNCVDVKIRFVLNTIVRLDVTSQILSVRGYFYLEWLDEFLKWNPCDYSGLAYLKFSPTEVWIPKLVIMGAADGKPEIYGGTEKIVVAFSGVAAWIPEGTYSTFCDISIKFYPFETQTCSLTIYSSDERADEVSLDILVGDAVVTSDYFSKNSEWEFMKLSTKRHVRYNTSMIELIFLVRLRPGFILWTTILPLVLLTLLNVCAFLIPIESGEKGSISVTLFMAYGVILAFMSADLPHNSLDVSYFIVYILILLMFSALTVVYTMVESRVYNYVGESSCKVLHLCRSVTQVSPVDSDKTLAALRDKHSVKDLTWKEFLRKLDVAVFFICLMMHITTSVVLFITMSSTDNHEQSK